MCSKTRKISSNMAKIWGEMKKTLAQHVFISHHEFLANYIQYKSTKEDYLLLTTSFSTRCRKTQAKYLVSLTLKYMFFTEISTRKIDLCIISPTMKINFSRSV